MGWVGRRRVGAVGLAFGAIVVLGLVWFASPGSAVVTDDGTQATDDPRSVRELGLPADDRDPGKHDLSAALDHGLALAPGENRSTLEVPTDVAANLDDRLLDVADLADRGLLGPEGSVPVVVRASTVPSRDLLREPTIHEPFGLVSGESDLGSLPELARASAIDHVYLDDRLELQLHDSVDRIDADTLHDKDADAGGPLTGANTTVAIVDSGVDYTHENLGGCLGEGCKVAHGVDYLEEDGDPVDEFGHGTHVAATAAGDRGVAPEATVHAYRVCDNGCPLSAILSAIEDATANGADVISMSLGGPGTTDSPLSVAADWAVDQGVVVVSAAGNSGPDNRTVGQPAASTKGIAVGASDGSGDVAWFSSRGPVVDGSGSVAAIKPDVLAPGVGIDAAVPTGDCALCDPSGQRSLSGTSMATPHVSGAAALLLEANPAWSPAQVKAALAGPARDLDRSPISQGQGLVDVFAAWNASAATTPPTGWLGVDVPTNDTFQAQANVTVHNLEDDPQTVKLADPTPTGFDVVLERGTLTLGAHGQATVAANLTADNDHAPDGWQQAAVAASANGTTTTAGLGFVKTGVLDLDLDPETFLVVTYRDGSTQHFLPHPGDEARRLAPPGEYHVLALSHNCPPDAEPCELHATSASMAEEVDHRGQTALTLEPNAEMHEIRYKASLLDGGTLEDGGTCFSADQDECIHRHRGQYLWEGFDSMLLRHGGSWNAPVFVDATSDDWNHGRTLFYRSDDVTYVTRNATTDPRSDTTLEAGPFTDWSIRPNLPETYEEGAWRTYCYHLAYLGDDAADTRPGSVWSFGQEWQALEDGRAQTIAFGGPDLEPVPFAGFEIAPAPCEQVRQEVHAGEHDPNQCTDDRGCPPAATSLLQEVHGDQVVRREPGYWVSSVPDRFDDRRAREGERGQGAIPLVDGAPTLEGRARVDGHEIRFTKSTYARTGTWFEPASGASPHTGVQRSSTDTEEPVTYELRQDDETVAEGALPPDQCCFTKRVPESSETELSLTVERTLLDDATGTTTYEATFPTPDDRRLPHLDWLRVNGDDGLDSRFGVAEDLDLYLKIHPRGPPVRTGTVTVDGPLDEVTYPLASQEGTSLKGQVIHQELAQMGPGEYDVTVTMVTDTGERLRLVQEPGFVVDATVDPPIVDPPRPARVPDATALLGPLAVDAG
jgi:subtilisin family serine protease